MFDTSLYIYISRIDSDDDASIVSKRMFHDSSTDTRCDRADGMW